jgi:hypothetical protein
VTGTTGRPSWLLGQFDLMDLLLTNREGPLVFKDTSTGEEHEVDLDGVSEDTCVLVPRVVGAYGLFMSAMVNLNLSARVKNVSLSMLEKLESGEKVTRRVIMGYFHSRSTEDAKRRTLEGILLAEDWFETDEFGSGTKIPRNEVIGMSTHLENLESQLSHR